MSVAQQAIRRRKMARIDTTYGQNRKDSAARSRKRAVKDANEKLRAMRQKRKG